MRRLGCRKALVGIGLDVSLLFVSWRWSVIDLVGCYSEPGHFRNPLT